MHEILRNDALRLIKETLNHRYGSKHYRARMIDASHVLARMRTQHEKFELRDGSTIMPVIGGWMYLE